ncbi:MAG: type I 3-dehydroquinate dehydratase [Planctomycetes bacterium]|nr:type I 3-dehydroquinate dehydratase [Planctomycetota bacterium]
MAEIVVSLRAREPELTVRAARRAAMSGADWIELRLDDWPVDRSLDELVGAIDLPVLATCRTPRDGGTFRGSPKERIALLESALGAGVRGLDLEDWESWTPRGDAVEMLVRSHHDLRGIPDDVDAIRDRLLDRGADVAKLVGMAHDLADAAPLLDLMARSDPEAEPTVAFAMGRTAGVTRLLACALGARLVYASLTAGDETAPGQIPVDDLVGVFGARRLARTTTLFGLLGNPALHSLGPWIHNRALRAADRDAVYLPFETSRPRETLAMLPARRLRGVSVTAPHKESMVKLCHRLTEPADVVGAVNTLTFEAGGAVVGHNTDVAGVREALLRAGLVPGVGGHGAVLGSGGAARAAAVALEQLGLRVTILARTLDSVREFARVRGYRLAALRSDVLLQEPPVAVVHATPAGSIGAESDRVLPEWTPPRGCRVLDTVYRPRWTRLLADALAAGAVPVPGLEMFLTQAAEQLGIFLGERPGEDELRRYLAGLE